MARRMLICLFILACSFVYAQLSPEVKPELVKTFKNSSNPGDIAVSIGGAYRPSGLGFAFDETGKLYISEQESDRISIFDEKYNYKHNLVLENEYPVGTMFLSVRDGVITSQDWTVWGRYDTKTGKMIKVEYGHSLRVGGHIKGGASFLIGDILISYKYDADDTGIVSTIFPSESDTRNTKNFRNTEQTRELFRNKDPIIPKGLRLDEKDVLYYNDEVLTGDFRAFLDYWKVKYGNDYFSLPEHKGDFYIGDAMSFLGKDKYGSWYWSSSYNQVMIFNKDGICQTVFSVPDDKSYTLPAFHPSGDMYFISYDKKNVYLWRVKKTW